MSSVNCPYDDTHCPDRESDRMAYKEFVRILAENNANRVFIQGDDNKCPRDYKCIRYQRYLNIIKKIAAIEKQIDGR